MLCDQSDAHCDISGPTSDPFGAVALIRSLQQDIHFNRLGGVPDLLPFDDGNAWTATGYGDVQYIRDHFNYIVADDSQEFNSGPNNLYNANPATGGGPQTTHQSLGLVNPGCAGGTPVNGPPDNECGGDVGGFVLPAGTANQGGQLQ
jgi:hypothetical protein